MHRLALVFGALALAGCASTGSGEVEKKHLGGGDCKAEPGQVFIGQKASPELGQKLLKSTRARNLRSVPPRTAVTMDFRADRLTVSYDDDMVIERVSCTRT